MRAGKRSATSASARAAEPPCVGSRKPPTRIWTAVGTQIRGRTPSLPRGTRETTLPRAETSQLSAPRRSTATGRSGTTTTRSVCGKDRSYPAESTAGSASTRRSSDRAVEREQARSEQRRERRPHLRLEPGRRTGDLDAANREDGALACGRVRPGGHGHDREADDERARSGQEPKASSRRARAPHPRGWERSRSRARARLPTSTLDGHGPRFAAGGSAPTRGRGRGRPHSCLHMPPGGRETPCSHASEEPVP